MDSVQFKFIDQNLTAEEKGILTPKQQSAGAAGFDLSSSSRNDLVLIPGERALVPTGIAMALPIGFEGQIRSRSGLSIKNGIVVLNAPGTIDADYRGEIKIILMNLSGEAFTVTFGMRIAQLVIAQVSSPTFREVSTLDQSIRGDGGFGSTGLAL